MHRITIFLAVGHAIIRAGMRKLLESEHDMTVVGETHDGAQVVAMAVHLQPSVMVLDFADSHHNCAEITRSVRVIHPGTKVLAFSDRSDYLHMDRVVDASVGGYILNDYSADEITNAVRMAHGGNRKSQCCHADVRHDLLLHQACSVGDQSRSHRIAHLTPREVKVLQLIADGYANKQTAVILAISKKTVEKHRDNLMKKLDIHNTAGLTRYAICTGIAALQAQYCP